MYEMQIFIGSWGKEEWVSIRPSGSYDHKPYQYPTEDEARHMLNICYPNMISERKRIVEITLDGSIKAC